LIESVSCTIEKCINTTVKEEISKSYFTDYMDGLNFDHVRAEIIIWEWRI